jgi:hypothetical protein
MTTTEKRENIENNLNKWAGLSLLKIFFNEYLRAGRGKLDRDISGKAALN